VLSQSLPAKRSDTHSYKGRLAPNRLKSLVVHSLYTDGMPYLHCILPFYLARIDALPTDCC